MNEILVVSLRTMLILILLFVAFKLMGKKQVSQMSMFDYITGITIGSIAADISLDIDKNLPAGVICLLIYCLVDLLISYLSLSSVGLRNFFNGKETPLIIDGKINKKNMARNKLTINNLQTEARLLGYFNLDEINNAILEPSGRISFEPKDRDKSVTKKDMGVKSQDSGLVYNLIVDGEIVDENLKHANKDRKWINHELKVLGKKKDDILLLTIDGMEKINVYYKDL